MSLFFKNKPVFAKVPFVFAGKQYEPGDSFEALPHLIDRMWFARKLTHDGVKTVTPIVSIVAAGKGLYHVHLSGAQMTGDAVKGKAAAKQWAIDNLGVTDDQIEA